MMEMEAKTGIPKGKTAITFYLPKELDQEFKDIVIKQYGSYHRGIFARAYELAIRNFVKDGKEIGTRC
jgi:hypothetical protein